RHLESLRLEDDARGAGGAPPAPTGRRALDLEHRVRPLRPRVRRGRTARSRRPARADRRRARRRGRVRRHRVRGRPSWPAALAAMLLFALSLYAVQRWLEQNQLSDVGGYDDYARFVRAGHVPYSDEAPLAYPPAAIVPWVVASYMSWSYATSFMVLMGVCGG